MDMALFYRNQHYPKRFQEHDRRQPNHCKNVADFCSKKRIIFKPSLLPISSKILFLCSHCEHQAKSQLLYHSILYNDSKISCFAIYIAGQQPVKNEPKKQPFAKVVKIPLDSIIGSLSTDLLFQERLKSTTEKETPCYFTQDTSIFYKMFCSYRTAHRD